MCMQGTLTIFTANTKVVFRKVLSSLFFASFINIDTYKLKQEIITKEKLNKKNVNLIRFSYCSEESYFSSALLSNLFFTI